MRVAIAACLLLVLGTPALSAAPGTAQNFLERANRLIAKGPLALLDGDYRRLRAEGIAAGTSIQRDREAMERRGQQPLYCSPRPRADLGNREFIRGLEAIPPQQRVRMPLKDAMLIVLQRKYPCPR